MILRIIVTICFLALAVIDQCSGSLIILSGYKFKDFLKPLYLVWAVLCVIGTPIAIILGMKYYPYKGQWISGVVNVCIYGFIVLRAVTSLIEKRKAGERNIRWLFFVPWLSMIVLMMASPNESLWPLWFGAMFGSFYITDFDKDKLSKIYNGAVDGVIAGCFLIQGIALFFRPYDTPRYFGMYLNPNINSLLYVCAYCAFLCRWFLLRKNGAKLIFRILSGAFAAAM